MTTPKEALELFGRYLDLSYTIDALTPETRDKMEIAIKAAIPVAELEHQAMELLEQYCNIIDDRFPIKDFLQWAKDRDALLARVEALKCK